MTTAIVATCYNLPLETLTSVTLRLPDNVLEFTTVNIQPGEALKRLAFYITGDIITPYCKTRKIYRSVISYFLYPTLEENLYLFPQEPIIWQRTLREDLFNIYTIYLQSRMRNHNSLMVKIFEMFHSPITYDYCPDDPKIIIEIKPTFFEKLSKATLSTLQSIKDYIVAFSKLFFFQLDRTWNYSELLSYQLTYILVVICFVVYLKYKHKYFDSQYYKSLLAYYFNSIDIPPSTVRNLFSSAPYNFKPVSGNHSHPLCAATRNSASAFCKTVANLAGYDPYYIQMSNSDQRKGLAGFRTYFWAKDFEKTPIQHNINNTQIPIFIDVDYYYDMPEYLAYNSNPVLISTFSPTKTGDSKPEYEFSFDKNSNLNYIVSGGATYSHKLWNYHVDTVTASATFLGIPYATTSYIVDRRTIAEHRDVILLTPNSHWGLSSILLNWLFPNESMPTLKRYDLLRGTHLRMKTVTPKGSYVSTSAPNQPHCAHILVQEDCDVLNLANSTKVGLNRASIQSRLRDSYPDEQATTSTQASQILYDYYVRNNDNLTTMELLTNRLTRLTSAFSFIPQPMTTTTYDQNPKEYFRYQYGKIEEDAKPSLYAYMKPLYAGAYAPDKTKGNEEQAVKKRITDIAKKNTADPFVLRIIEEFIELLVPTPGLLKPHDIEEVERRQPKPQQQVHLRNAENAAFYKPYISTFLKAEAYPKPSDPRLVSTLPAKLKVEYSRYTYAISDWLKGVKCYAFGRHPNEIDEHIARTCIKFGSISPTDFSRYDGTISPAARTFETMLIHRLFPASCHKEIEKLHNNQFNLLAYCPYGTTYHQGTARASGSPETSIFNSLWNMFSAYLGHRKTRDGTGFRSSAKAWEYTNDGLYGGDDGLTPMLDKEAYEGACHMIGLNVKLTTFTKPEMGVNFLGRIYGPDIWHGDTSNCADFKKQLFKLHVTHIRPGLSDDQILLDKTIGLTLSDANTPVLGPFARKAQELKGNLQAAPDGSSSYRYITANAEDPTTHFNNPQAFWYREYVTQVMPNFNYDQFENWLAQADCLHYLLNAPKFYTDLDPVEMPKETIKINNDYHVTTLTTTYKKEKQQREVKVRGAKRRIKDRHVAKPAALPAAPAVAGKTQ